MSPAKTDKPFEMLFGGWLMRARGSMHYMEIDVRRIHSSPRARGVTRQRCGLSSKFLTTYKFPISLVTIIHTKSHTTHWLYNNSLPTRTVDLSQVQVITQEWPRTIHRQCSDAGPWARRTGTGLFWITYRPIIQRCTAAHTGQLGCWSATSRLTLLQCKDSEST